VADAGSHYGTYVDGRRVEQETELKPGDTIRVGEVDLAVEQYVPERELLSDSHALAEGPGTIFRPMRAQTTPGASGDGELIRLLGELNRAIVSNPFADMLNHVVDLAFAAVPADRAFLMLRDEADGALSARVLRQRDGCAPPDATLSRTVVRRVMQERVAVLAADATTDPHLGASDSIIALNIRSFMCAPLWSQDTVIGVLYVDSPRSARFRAADLDAFTALANAAAVAIAQARLSNQLLEETRRRERLQRYHSPAIVTRILQGDNSDSGLRAQEREVTVMFCDIVDFTALSERLSPAETATALNAFLTRMTDVVFAHEGTLDKFLGDALLAVFGAPFDQADHAMRAVEAALAMRQALAELNERPDVPKLEMRVTINTGVALAGDFGSPKRREFTVLGDVVNTASRMENEIAAPGEIVVAGSTFARVKDRVIARPLGSRTVRGRGQSLDTYAVEGLAPYAPQTS
jgi:adenylate cyclase